MEENEKRVEKSESKLQKIELDKTAKKSISFYKPKTPRSSGFNDKLVGDYSKINFLAKYQFWCFRLNNI
ncbi:hypothetical protein [Borreliella andersonii]|uniref:Uncharacterized protein n=1 Tax=Borrelia andersonii TaxID=42109 RepID=A0ACD5G5V9_BORAD